MKKQNIFKLLFVGAFISAAIIFSQPVSTQAESTLQAIGEQNAGLSSAPDNLGLNNDLFEVPDFKSAGYVDSNGTSVGNTAALMNSLGSSAGGNLRAIRMTSFQHQVGAIWSNVDTSAGSLKDNSIDIQKKQTLSMWLYFGPSEHTGGGEFGDGMAFVLQNGDVPVSHQGSLIGDGESLGVWGVDRNKKTSSAQTIANSAIPNSWAIEFDTHANTSSTPGAADYFDNGISGQHIADGYPALATTYNRSGGLLSGYAYSQNHTDVQSNLSLHDGAWHHLTVSWNPITKKITYSFNDKNVDGSKGTNPITVTTSPMTSDNFGTIPDDKLRWGFTATTGDYFQANLIAFESLPALVEGDATATIYDNTEKKDVADGDAVNSNDNLAITYKLNYDSGRNDWSNIKASLNLPKNITYAPDANGNIGQIVYPSGKTEDIKYSDLKNNAYYHELTENLNSTNKTATITFNGVASTTSSSTNVASVRSHIDSDSLIKDIDTPAFVIKKSKPITLTLDSNNLSVGSNEDAKITGKVSYADGVTPVVNSDVSVYAKLNGMALDTVKLNSSDAAGQLNFVVPSGKLLEGTNNLEIYVQDKDGNTSSVSNVTITRSGSLTLTVNKDYGFGSINQVDESQLLPRKGNWDITVNDNREISKSSWNLTASTNGLYNGTTAFNGNLVYINGNGDETALINNEPVDIASGLKTATGDQVTDVSKVWNSTSGIFLRSNAESPAGKYQGEIDWTLSDTI